VIGKKDERPAALKFLSNRVVSRPGKRRRHVIIDAEGYRARREDASPAWRRLGKRAVDRRSSPSNR
jgi:spoIIIJ-associated protein